MDLRATLPFLVLPLLASCSFLGSSDELAGVGVPADEATVEIRASTGTELGVSTDYGIVFLGRKAHGGLVDWTAWFSDGPSFESGAIEPVGGGLYTVASEIRIPTVPLTFRTPAPGSSVVVVGRRGGATWEREVAVEGDPRVEGILLAPDIGPLDESQVGAGVYVESKGRRRLVGLVSGRLRLTGKGGTKDYVTVVGPRGLWHLVTYPRNVELPRRPVYREDVL